MCLSSQCQIEDSRFGIQDLRFAIEISIFLNFEKNLQSTIENLQFLFAEIPCSSRQKSIKCGNTEEKYLNWVKNKESKFERPGFEFPQRGF
jgi:hypothetical protein